MAKGPIVRVDTVGFGGLFNSFGRARVPKGQLYRGYNASFYRTILEARPGFRQLYRRASDPTGDVCYGFGYGKYGSTEKYLLFTKRSGQTKCDVVSLTPGNTAATVSSATATASLWSTAQHDQYVYAGNATDGLWRYSLSDASWVKPVTTFQSITSPTSDVLLQKPPATRRAWDVSAPADAFASYIENVGQNKTAAFGAYTPSADQCDLAISDSGTEDFSRCWTCVTLQGAEDFRNSRYLLVSIAIDNVYDVRDNEYTQFCNVGGGKIGPQAWGAYWTDDAAASTAGDWSAWFKCNSKVYGTRFGPYGVATNASSGCCTQVLLWIDLDSAGQNAKLDEVRKIAIGVPFSMGIACTVSFFPFYLGGVWLNKANDSDTMTSDPVADYSLKPCEYALTNYDGTNESAGTLYSLTAEDACGDAAWPGGPRMGAQALFQLPISTGAGSHATRLYRRRRSDGDKWYKIHDADLAAITAFYDSRVDAASDGGNVAGNAYGYWGTTTFASSTVFGVVTQDILPSCMAAWKTHMVCGVGKELYFSRAMNAEQYVLPLRESSTAGAVDTSDLTQGRTCYMSQDQSDDVMAIVAQDVLYPVGRRGVYAMIGDSAIEATPPRYLPNSRGVESSQSAIGFSGGVLVGARDGLWFYRALRVQSSSQDDIQSGEELTKDVRTSWKQLFTEYPDNTLVLGERDGEIWAFRGSRYMRRTKEGLWEEGEFNRTALYSGGTGSDPWDYPTTGSGDWPTDPVDVDPDDPPGTGDDPSDDPVVCLNTGWTITESYVGYNRRVYNAEDDLYTWLPDGSNVSGPPVVATPAVDPGVNDTSYRTWGYVRFTASRSDTAANKCIVKAHLKIVVHSNPSGGGGWTPNAVCTISGTVPTALTLTKVNDNAVTGRDWEWEGDLIFAVTMAPYVTTGHRDVSFDITSTMVETMPPSGSGGIYTINFTPCYATVAVSSVAVQTCATATNY